MKQQKLSGYTPNYPKKAVKGMALAAAALIALGTGAGCSARAAYNDGTVPSQESTPGVWETARPEDVELEGAIAIDDTETPEPEDVRTGGIAMPEETPEPEEIVLMGDVAIFDEP